MRFSFLCSRNTPAHTDCRLATQIGRCIPTPTHTGRLLPTPAHTGCDISVSTDSVST